MYVYLYNMRLTSVCLSVCSLWTPKPFGRSSPNLALSWRDISRVTLAWFHEPSFTGGYVREGESEGGGSVLAQVERVLLDPKVASLNSGNSSF